ncbi:hypothetical protein V6Z12_A03G200100 [Gossypium hirsutum]
MHRELCKHTEFICSDMCKRANLPGRYKQKINIKSKPYNSPNSKIITMTHSPFTNKPRPKVTRPKWPKRL